MDFYKIQTRFGKNKSLEVYANFIIGHSKDIMVREKNFYAVWDEESGMWSTDEYDIAKIVDRDIRKKVEELKESATNEGKIVGLYLSDYSSRSWREYKNYISQSPNNVHQLNTKIVFSNTEVKKNDYISRRLDYALEDGDITAYDKLMHTLYSDEERQKIEWAIGAIIAGDAKKIQKFIVLYGDAGAGKSTVLNIIQDLFRGYYCTFNAKELASTSNVFATDAFAKDPLVGIQHDGDLSKITDNSQLNSIISHEEIIINEKFKGRYSTRANCFLFMATNQPVKITDAKSGLIRRLIDVHPSGNKLPPEEYDECMNDIQYELGSIAKHCLNVYLSMGKTYYNSYKPLEMMYKTDPFFNFVENCYYIFKEQEGVSLKQAYSMYKDYCKEANADYILQMYKFREEFKNYFKEFYESYTDEEGNRLRSYFKGFKESKFKKVVEQEETKDISKKIVLKEQESKLDILCGDCLAQYATSRETPTYKWEKVQTILNDIDSRKLHYVKLPENHIVIDFDIKDEQGNKSLELNLAAASKWPETYTEVSKGGQGLHLHYIYTGDVSRLSNLYDDNIEIKTFKGGSAIRRKLSLCNDKDISVISSGLPLKKKESKMVNLNSIKNEKVLRSLIMKNLNREIHANTAPSIDFIFKLLEEAYESGIPYDVSDMRQAILVMATSSTNQAQHCLEQVSKMKFKSEEHDAIKTEDDGVIIFLDVEVFPNLFLINWKKAGPEHSMVRMINPSPSAVEDLLKYKIVGFNCRRYDNHMLHARIMGYSNYQLFKLSQRIVSLQKNGTNPYFGEAYEYSYADIYDISSKKQSLKKWEIELGITHKELKYKWDEPVPEDKWGEVAEYCDNDVYATEAVWNTDSFQQEFIAREILSSISGLSVNSTNRQHTTKIIFGDEKHPELNYVDLSEDFPGYEFVLGDDNKMHNMYRGTDVGFGGYVYAEPGMYKNVGLLDVESMHPSSIEAMKALGEYTKIFSELKQARIYIKHGQFEEAGKLFNGALKPYLKDESQAKALSGALKIVINSVYGYTCATFDNPFKDPRNVNNFIALRGALFMRMLQDEVKEMGYQVVHIKTDSIKIPNVDDKIIEYCKKRANDFGYKFELEAVYDKLCLVNDAVYIAKSNEEHEFKLSTGEKILTKWTATGKQFQIPYVFKTLFAKKEVKFSDLCETISVSEGSLYLDMNENLEPDEHNYIFVGRVGKFTPIKEGKGGGELFVERKDKMSYPSGCKGYRWLESYVVDTNKKYDDIDISYYETLANKAVAAISEFGSFEWFISDDISDWPFIDKREGE